MERLGESRNEWENSWEDVVEVWGGLQVCTSAKCNEQNGFCSEKAKEKLYFIWRKEKSRLDIKKTINNLIF